MTGGETAMPRQLHGSGRLDLVQALRIGDFGSQACLPGGHETRGIGSSSCIAFVGAGGKSTGMFQLARSLKPPVITTTTTHLGQWQTHWADSHLIVQTRKDLEKALQALDGVVLITGPIGERRGSALDRTLLDQLFQHCQQRGFPLLIEADGSRGKPLKAPADHEPSIPEFVQQVVVVAGLSALGKPLTAEFVHRPELFSNLSESDPGETIHDQALVRVLLHAQGGQKNIPPTARRTALLNQADTSELQARAKAISRGLLPAFHAAVTASLLPPPGELLDRGESARIFAVHEPIGAVILAAGEAKRFGKPKQLLDWQGEPFVRKIAHCALQAGLKSVILVTGAYAHQVGEAVADLPVRVVHNPDWQSGQAGSLRCGLAALCAENTQVPGAAFFLLSDQPQLSSEILRALSEEHARGMAAVLAPLVEGQRANPVLFDRRTFPDLMRLEGDTGGRALFSKYSPTYLPWYDTSLLLDVDEPEDYQRLVESWG